jgi:subtilase family serine protease
MMRGPSSKGALATLNAKFMRTHFRAHLCPISAITIAGTIFGIAIAINVKSVSASASQFGSIDTYEARPPIHIMSGTTAGPSGLFPAQVKKAYHLPATGGSGTIAIISAYHHPDIENDLAVFDKTFGLASCTVKNKCLTDHAMNTGTKDDSGWDMETALDVEWAHAIAPKAKILVVEAASDSGSNLLKAVDYARAQSGVVSISMSWGGEEFSGETALDSHFSGGSGASGGLASGNSATGSPSPAFFASSGDDGAGASWPAVSPNVIAVGGTSLSLTASGIFSSEKAWSGSGGGVSSYENEPAYEKSYSIPRAGGKRAIPDVAYAADPAHGFSVYHKGKWYMVGGTSAGAPQWAAIASLGAAAKHPVTLSDLYGDKASAGNASFFRDIKSGTNGDCAYYCVARARYDYVTGLGSPLTYKF